MQSRKANKMTWLKLSFAGLAGFSLFASTHTNALDTYFNWGDQTITGMLMTIFNWLAVGVSIAVVAGIIYGAILYITSAGDSGKAQKGIEAIRNAVIALILYFAMFTLLNFLVPGGLFT
jgi:hypothetical protein